MIQQRSKVQEIVNGTLSKYVFDNSLQFIIY